MTGAAEMTALLTPEQIAGIVERDKYDSDPIAVADSDRRALLRDREAICERLDQCLLKARRYPGCVVVSESIEELLSELRGGK